MSQIRRELFLVFFLAEPSAFFDETFTEVIHLFIDEEKKSHDERDRRRDSITTSQKQATHDLILSVRPPGNEKLLSNTATATTEKRQKFDYYYLISLPADK